MRALRPILLISLLFIALAPACSKEKKLGGNQIFARENEAEIVKFRQQLTAITAAAAAAPPLASDGFTEPVEIDIREYSTLAPETGNTRVWQLAKLQASDRYPDVKVSLGGVLHRLRDLDDWIADHSKSPPGMDDVERFLDLEYVLVVRVHKAEEPEKLADKSFKGGGVAGDALLYRLADGAALGGVRYGAVSSASIAVTGAAAQADGLDRANAVARDLSSEAHMALGKALKAASPSIELSIFYK